MATLSKQDQEALAQAMDKATAESHKIPGCVFVSVNAKGEQIFAHASGKRGLGSDEPMTLESTFWIASCTKMLCALSCMQLVEAGRLRLDDAESLEALCPELRQVQIVTGVDRTGRPQYKKPEKRITLRHLLSHTAGFGYAFFEPLLKQSNGAEGWDEFSGDASDVLAQPLLSEPGERWRYGVNLDWAGLALERVTGKTLNEYFQQHVFKPLGISEINMFPDAAMKSRLSYMHQKSDQGTRVRDHLHRRALSVKPSQYKDIFNSGGAGCFARPTEYTKILATLLNNGTSPETGHQLLRPESVDELLKNQIPQFPDFGRVLVEDAKPDLTNPVPELYAQPHDQPQGWSFAGMVTIHPGGTGRGSNTVWWAGLANLFWWVDREKGVAGMIASQILPFADPNVMGLWVEVEAGIYKALANGGA